MISKLIPQHILDLAKVIYGALSIIFLIVSMLFALIWVLSNDYVYQLKPFANTHQTISSQGDVFNTSVIIFGTGQAIYYKWIVNEKGETVYTYPEYKIHSVAENHINQGVIYIPPLQPGSYVLKTKLFYRSNPWSVSEIELILGRFTVK